MSNKTSQIVSIPTVQVRPNYLVIYNQLEGLRRRQRDTWQYTLNDFDRKKAYAGFISPGSAKNLKRCLENLIEISIEKKAVHHTSGKQFKFKINFITLTLPHHQGKWTDKDVKKMCLDTWLKSARRSFGLKSYVWRAERQHNGNIHFHIASDCYIDHVALRHSWNDRLEHCNYISRFEEKHGHRNPNSTDVHSVRKVQNLAAYLIKYMSKGPHLRRTTSRQTAQVSTDRKSENEKERPKISTCPQLRGNENKRSRVGLFNQSKNQRALQIHNRYRSHKPTEKLNHHARCTSQRN